jgi:parallel beta-helix repeat protein
MKEGVFRKGLVCAIIILFVGTSFVSAFNVKLVNESKPMNRGNWLYVGGNGPGNYTHIQSAINAANDGDTVFVYSSSYPYHESVVIDKSINLIGENRDTTIIDGNSSGYYYIINISADQVKISGFTIYCGLGGIYIGSYGNNISGNNIVYAEETGIYLSDSNNTIVGNTIKRT